MQYFISIKYSGGACQLKLNGYLAYTSDERFHNYSTLANTWMNKGENEIHLRLKGSKNEETEEHEPVFSPCIVNVFKLTENLEKEFIYEHEISSEEIKKDIAIKLTFKSEGELLYDSPPEATGIVKPWLTDVKQFQRDEYDKVKSEILAYFIDGNSQALIKKAGTKLEYLAKIFDEPEQDITNDLLEQLNDFFKDFKISDGENLDSLTTYQKIHECGVVRIVDMRGEAGLVGFDRSGELCSGFELYLARTKEGIQWVF